MLVSVLGSLDSTSVPVERPATTSRENGSFVTHTTGAHSILTRFVKVKRKEKPKHLSLLLGVVAARNVTVNVPSIKGMATKTAQRQRRPLMLLLWNKRTSQEQ